MNPLRISYPSALIRACLWQVAASAICLGLDQRVSAADPKAKIDKGIRLETVAQGVRLGEQLFENVAMEYLEVEDLLLPPEKRSRDIDYVTHEEQNTLVVWQAGKLHFQERKLSRSVKNPTTERKEIAIRFDKQFTRSVRVAYTENETRTAGYASIVSGNPEIPEIAWALSPLQLGNRIGKYKLSQTFDGTYTALSGGTDAEEVSVEGVEEIEKLACVRLAVRTYRVDPKSPTKNRKLLTRELLWLAIEQHFLPVRSQMFGPDEKSQLPGVTTDTSDWREIEPGVKVPFHAVKRTFWINGGVSLPESVNTVTVKACSVRPAYPDAFFSDLQIPNGLLVNVHEGDDLVRQYIQGEEPKSPTADVPGWSLRRWLFVISAVLVAILVAARVTLWLFRRRRKPAV